MNLFIQSWAGFNEASIRQDCMDKFKKNLLLGPSEKISVKYFFNIFNVYKDFFFLKADTT